MLEPGVFHNYDDDEVYKLSQAHAEDENTRNFIVKFGKDKAEIAFDCSADGVAPLLETPRSSDLPIRWINIWAPDQQKALTKAIGAYYHFSPRLLAIICSRPNFKHLDHHSYSYRERLRTRVFPKGDVELANGVARRAAHAHSRHDAATHYSIANQLINYQSVDFGDHFICVGANWMHHLPHSQQDDWHYIRNDSQRRLWSWLILCDDRTVISLHEDPGPSDKPALTRALRENTLSVLSQLSTSENGWTTTDPISIQSVRQMLDTFSGDLGLEGASTLYYYLFEDWRSTYGLISGYQRRLEDLSASILGDLHKDADVTPGWEIIPRLHILGREMRSMQHLYENYNNVVDRILKASDSGHKHLTDNEDLKFEMVVLTRSATQRFERLGDRIRLLVLSELSEYLAEKDALVSTYFNINAQKDSDATARLTRSATLLAKLSVLFLPVSLMTSYFSVQIEDLQGIYTARTYWISFAVIMKSIDDQVRTMTKVVRRRLAPPQTDDR